MVAAIVSRFLPRREAMDSVDDDVHELNLGRRLLRKVGIPKSRCASHGRDNLRSADIADSPKEKVKVALSSMSFECTRRNTTAKQPLFLPYSPYAVHSILSQLSTYRLSTTEKNERKTNRLWTTATTMNKPNEQRDQYILWSATTSACVMFFLVVDFLEVV